MENEEPERPRCEGYLFDCFEASLKLGTILQKGERLKVQRLPFKMLLALLEKPGEVVTKEQLARELWDQQVINDTDQSLYVMARKLRHLLGDDANQPRFIQTISGEGYTFIGKVTQIFPPPTTLPWPPFELPAGQIEEKDSDSSLAPESRSDNRATRKTMRKPVWAAAVVAAALFGGAGISIYRYQHRALMSDQDKVVLGAFSNNSGNADLDQTLSAALQSQLQESPYLSLVSDHSLRALVKNPASASLQDELRACTTLTAQILVKGRISTLPQGYEVSLTAWSCASRRELTTQNADASSDAAILPAIDLAAVRMRRRLGESEASLKKFKVPVVQATTGSLAALKAFNFGNQMASADDANAAASSYKLAIDIDPDFALAYARLGMIYYNSGQFALGAASFKRAFELRSSRASDRERLYIVSHYYEFATGQIQRAIEVNELWHALYPRDTVPMHNLGAKYVLMGHPEPALALAQEAIQQEPNLGRNYDLLALVYTSLGRYADVFRLCQDPLHGKTRSVGFHQACFDAAFASNDEVAMQRELQSVQGTAEESELIADSAWAAMYHGKLSKDRMLFHEAEQTAMRSKVLDLAADIGLDEAMLEAEVGSRTLARRDVERVLQLPFESASEQAYAARVLARSGDASKALFVAKKAVSMAPLDDLVNSAMLPTVKAAIELQEANPKGALDALESRDFDLCCRVLVPGYYRGLAYLDSEQPELAKREFQNVIDHRFLSSSFSIYLVLSELELGHAYKLLGDSANANAAFAKVDSAWKDADPSFPPLEKLRRYKGLPAIAR